MRKNWQGTKSRTANSLGRRKNEMEGGKQEYSGNPQKVLPPDKCANDALK